MALELWMTNDVGQVRGRVAQGFCPVECSVGGQSVVDGLMMDHHGELSGLESVAIRALRDHAGARSEDPRFVGVGQADADMTFAVAALSGILPDDPRVGPLAELIALVDTEPIGVDIASSEVGGILMVWNTLSGSPRDTASATAAVYLWRTLLCLPAQTLALFEAVARQRLQARQEAAREALEAHGRSLGLVLAIERSPVWGFDVWYGRRQQGAFGSVEGWEHPVVVALSQEPGRITVGCPNAAVARELFGPDGLRHVFEALEPKGWGGREAIGGSPRGVDVGADALYKAAECLERFILR